MVTPSVKPLDLISKDQYEEIKKKEDWRNVLSITLSWLQMIAAITLFYLFPNIFTF